MKQLLLSLVLLMSFGCPAQQTDVVDFLEIKANLYVSQEKKSVEGGVQVKFQMLKDADSVYLDAIGMERISLDDDYSDVRIEASDDKFWFIGKFEKDRKYDYFFSYRAKPKQTLYFTGDQIWTQGQGKYTSHWLPSLDDMNDKIEFDLSILVEADKRVITNGALKSLTTRDNESLIVWNFNMEEPISSYLVALVIGDFDKKIIESTSGIPIELNYRPEDSLKVEPTYRYTKEIFDFLEEEIGVPYPWQNYKQVPVRDFLYAGMENTTATIFSEAFVVDSIGFNDRNYVNVNAHEMAHHWFGNLVTETSGTHHWLQEGFATYYAHLAEKEIFGEEYFYWVMYQSAEQLKELSDQGKGESLLDPKASSLTFYEKGAWALHVLREEIGDEAFRLAIRSYLRNNRFQNVSTEDFLKEVRAATSIDISEWEEDWLQQTAFKAMQAYNSLSESEFMDRYFQVSSLRAGTLAEKAKLLEEAIEDGNDFIGQEAVYQLAGEDPSSSEAIYEKALDSDNLYIRQAVALSIDGVTESLKPKFEKLLNDSSYVTIEAALFSLWNSFPDSRALYLDQTENVIGFQDKNVRQLWLALAIITPDYREGQKPEFVEELQAYSGTDLSFEIRQKAFEYLAELRLYNEPVIDNLVDASVHHNWRFRNGARNLLKQLSGDPEVMKILTDRLEQFTERERQYLTTNILSE